MCACVCLPSRRWSFSPSFTPLPPPPPPPQGQSVLDPEFPPPPISSSPPFLSFCERRGESGYCCSRANITLSPIPTHAKALNKATPFLFTPFLFPTPSVGCPQWIEVTLPPILLLQSRSFLSPLASHGQESEKRTSALFQPKPNPSPPSTLGLSPPSRLSLLDLFTRTY